VAVLVYIGDFIVDKNSNHAISQPKVTFQTCFPIKDFSNLNTSLELEWKFLYKTCINQRKYIHYWLTCRCWDNKL